MEKALRRRYFKRSIVGGLPADVCTEADLVRVFCREVEMDRAAPTSAPARLVFDLNGQALALALVDRDYASYLHDAEILHVDGQPLCIASRLLCKEPIPERTATTDLIHAVGRAFGERDYSVYFLGASPKIVAAAVEKYRELYPKSRVVGFRDGYFDPANPAGVIEDINAVRPDLVFVGMGKTREQAFCVKYRNSLQTSWVVTAGGCFDFMAGANPRAPEWMQRNGLEWLFRVSVEPRRLLWRYVWTNIVSGALLLTRTRREPV